MIRVHIAAGISGLVAVGAAVLALFVLREIPAGTHMEEQPDRDGEGAIPIELHMQERESAA